MTSTTPLQSNYLNRTVYLRQGTRHLLPETEVNKKDPTLVPMSVKEAINLGYLTDPRATLEVNDSERILQDENERLGKLIEAQKIKLLEIEELKSQLEEKEALLENKVSVGSPVPLKVDELQPAPTEDLPAAEEIADDQTEQQLAELFSKTVETTKPKE